MTPDIDARLDALEGRLQRLAVLQDFTVDRVEAAISAAARVDAEWVATRDRIDQRHAELLTYLDGLDAGQSALIQALVDLLRRFDRHRSDGHGG